MDMLGSMNDFPFYTVTCETGRASALAILGCHYQ